jgi:hypothetical protein
MVRVGVIKASEVLLRRNRRRATGERYAVAAFLAVLGIVDPARMRSLTQVLLSCGGGC